MPDGGPPRGDAALENDLRAYFGVTTSTAMPRRVSETSSRTLAARRLAPGWMAPAATVVVLASALLGIATHLPSGSGVTSGAGSIAAAPQASAGAGVDAHRLAQAGITLLAPSSHATPAVTAAQARSAAAAQAGPGAGVPGPAQLADVQLTQLSTKTTVATCLCWVVEVPLGGGAAGSSTPSELVLVDARSGRVVEATSVGD